MKHPGGAAVKLLQMSPAGDWEGAVTPERLSEILEFLRGAGGVPLSTLQVAERLARVVRAWESREYLGEALRHAEELGTSPEMLEWGLRDLLSRLTERGLIALVEAELGSVEPFQHPRSRELYPCARGAVPPQLLVQVLAGTVPPVGIEAIVLALLARAPVLLKTASDEPVVAKLFLRSLRELAPELAERVAVLTWDGGGPLDEQAVSAASEVCAYGGNHAINRLLGLVRYPTRFFAYGHRVSAAILEHPQRAVRDVARDLALDVAAFEQRGCMSPHCLYVVEGEGPPAQEWAEAIVGALNEAGERFPRPSPDGEGARRTREAEALTVLRGGQVLSGPGGAVAVHRDGHFRASPGDRFLNVMPVGTREECVASLGALRGALSTVGLECRTQAMWEWTHALQRVGVPRITRVGRMQRPLWVRDHDGRPRIADWVRWTNLEPF